MNLPSKPKLIFYLAAIFLVGGVTGATVAVKATKQIMAEPPKTGLVIHVVDPNGPAASAGVHTMDVLEAINGIPMNNPTAYSKFFADKKPGDRVSMKIWESGQTRNVDLSLVDSTAVFNTP